MKILAFWYKYSLDVSLDYRLHHRKERARFWRKGGLRGAFAPCKDEKKGRASGGGRKGLGVF